MAWALYDWGNSAFALSVLAVLFPLFLGSYWSAGDPGPAVTARLTWATVIASVIVSLMAPVLGAIADSGGWRKRFLAILTVLGVVSTVALSLVGLGDWYWALALFILASIGYYGAAVFYDSLIVDVSHPRYYSLISSLGLSLGYFGGAFLLSLHVWMMYTPASFGFAESTDVIKFAFVSVGAWWLIFLLPILLLVREAQSPNVVRKGTVRAAYRALRTTITKIRSYRNIYTFLAAYWLYIGGLFTVIFMAVNFGQRLGFADQDLVIALMITNYVGFPATLLFGFLAHRFGMQRAIIAGLVVYILIVCWAVFLEDVRQFYVMSIIIGTVQGGVQSISRSLYASLIPKSLSGEFFGFYNMLTKFAHILGPVLIGVTLFFSDDPRFILLAILPMFVLGALILTQVKVPEDAA
ncbi:MAG: MFS transporter [Pseudomonadota bacterium]|nr:MFS transporter [Pseudomonadota bacterium]